ncbi:hypothetical protein ACIP88_17330 [Streptomyces uncialis]|uniref:hypothetical protein n=1 Tax=Streptomyces uncialis TaxID=1048205 RepID=UPI00381BAB8F
MLLDGASATGTSAFASALAERHGHPLVRSSRIADHRNLHDCYRNLLTRPGPLILDGSFVSDFVPDPLLTGSSRLIWSQALDLAGTVARGHGVLIHVVTTAPACPDPHPDQCIPCTRAAITDAYRRAFDTLSAHTAVLTADMAHGPVQPLPRRSG